jgi:hypothetical protein
VRVGVQFCGSCDPDYDMTQVVAVLDEEAARASLELVRPDDLGRQAVLVVEGCRKQCFRPDECGCVPMRQLLVTGDFNETGSGKIQHAFRCLTADLENGTRFKRP